MSFSGPSLLVMLVFSTVGLGLFLYGKKARRIPQLVAGLLLMIYPYFVDGALAMLLIGAAILGALWFAVRRGFLD